MVGHTPGPWEVAIILDARRQIPEGAAIAVGAPNGTTETPGHRSVVALCGHPYDDFHAAASFADAHLIAAAPALYEALEKVVAEAEAHPFNSIGHVVEHVIPEIRAALSAARPAPTTAPEGDDARHTSA
jgi:hypothetical protein